MKKFFSLFFVSFLLVCFPQNAFAGDKATIILKSGIILRLANGFNQISAGMKKLNSQGFMNFPVEINIEGTTMYINLGEVAMLCRDNCNSVQIEFPKKENR